MPAARPAAAFRPAPAPAPAHPPKLLNDPFAPETFTTGCCGLSIGPSTVTLTLESARCDHSDAACPVERVVVGRVVMPLQAAQALVLQLNDALSRSGLSPTQAVTVGMMPQ